MPMIRNITAQSLEVPREDAGRDEVAPGESIEVEDPTGYVASGMWEIDSPKALNPAVSTETAQAPKEG